MKISTALVEYSKKFPPKDTIEYAMSSGAAITTLLDGSNMWEFEDGSLALISKNGIEDVTYSS
jgi:hypothetical protein